MLTSRSCLHEPVDLAKSVPACSLDYLNQKDVHILSICFALKRPLSHLYAMNGFPGVSPFTLSFSQAKLALLHIFIPNIIDSTTIAFHHHTCTMHMSIVTCSFLCGYLKRRGNVFWPSKKITASN